MDDLVLVFPLGLLVVLVIVLAFQIDEPSSGPPEWRTFETPGGQYSCHGWHDDIKNYDIGRDCVPLPPEG